MLPLLADFTLENLIFIKNIFSRSFLYSHKQFLKLVNISARRPGCNWNSKEQLPVTWGTEVLVAPSLGREGLSNHDQHGPCLSPVLSALLCRSGEAEQTASWAAPRCVCVTSASREPGAAGAPKTGTSPYLTVSYV